MTQPRASDPRMARRKRGVALLSIAVNVVLLAVKGMVAIVTGSVALLASAADSLLDLTASVFALLGVHVGSRPPDDTHAYGHEKFESLAGLAQLTLLFVTVGIIGFEAWSRLWSDEAPRAPAVGISVIVLNLVVAWWISRRLARVAAESGGSQALEADALHFSTDVWSNLAVIVGLAAAQLGLPLGDPLAAFVVAFLIFVTAFGLLRKVLRTLTDRAPAPHVVERLTQVLSSFPGVVDHHTLRARVLGSRIYLDVCVELDPHLTFQRAHDLSHELHAALREAVPQVTDAVIHYEPAGHPHHQDDAHHAHGFNALDTRRGNGQSR